MLKKIILLIIAMIVSFNVFATNSCSNFYGSQNYVKYELYFGKMHGSQCAYNALDFVVSYEGFGFDEEYDEFFNETEMFKELTSFLWGDNFVDKRCSVIVFHNKSNKTCKAAMQFEVENNIPVNFRPV